jgi:hypothetical protein
MIKNLFDAQTFTLISNSIKCMHKKTVGVGIATGYGLEGPGSIPDSENVFLFSTASRPTLGPTLLPIKWVPEVFSPGVKRKGVKLTTHLHLVLRSINVELYLRLHMSSWHSA